MSVLSWAYTSKLMRWNAVLIVCVAVGMTVNLVACQSEDVLSRPDATEYPRTVSNAIIADDSTALGRSLQPAMREHPGQSGFHLLETGSESLSYRLALIQAAEKTLDLQYYTIHDDVSANLLLEALLRAAERGVRVRFIIDYISMKEVGRSLSVLDGAKNLEIRVFNPPSIERQNYLSRIAGMVNDMGKWFKRMHNKALIADNQLAILGGRNLGDEYFEAHSDSNFKDLDLLAAGPVVNDVSQSFDTYWNGDDTFPIASVRRPSYTDKQISELRAELKTHWDKESQTEDGRKLLRSNLGERLKEGRVGLVWARAELEADHPDKIDEDADEAESEPLDRLERLTAEAREEFIIISPYFVPREEGVQWLTGLVERGVKVKVLTNSLASTDVVAVHTGYRKYRKVLLEQGVELYEFKAKGGDRPKQRLFGGTAPAHASLHTKMYVIDRSALLIGSFNLDPRSVELNTEIAMVVYSPFMARQVLKMFEEAVDPASSYRLTLNEDNDLRWVAEEEGNRAVYTYDPEAGWRKVQVWLMGLLPVEDQL